MAVTDSLWNLVQMTEIFRKQIPTIKPFYLQLFNRQINFEGAKILFEAIGGDDRYLAPFVIPTMIGRGVRLEGGEARSFAPAYIKMLDVVNPHMVVQRQVGEGLGGTLSMAQRRALVRAELLRQHRTRITNRLEWLASRAIIDGKVTIKGEDYPETLVDFRRDANLTTVLSGAARWNQSTGNPLGDLKASRIEANGLSGARIVKIIMGGNAWASFCARVDIKEMTNKNYGGQTTNLSLINDDYEGSQEYMGFIQGSNGQGRIEIWVDTSKFKDAETGAETYFLDQDTVVGVSSAVEGVRCFGAIMDDDAGYLPLEYYFKNYKSPNPSAEFLLSQSAPLMVPREPNATFSIKVQ